MILLSIEWIYRVYPHYRKYSIQQIEHRKYNREHLKLSAGMCLIQKEDQKSREQHKLKGFRAVANEDVGFPQYLPSVKVILSPAWW